MMLFAGQIIGLQFSFSLVNLLGPCLFHPDATSGPSCFN